MFEMGLVSFVIAQALALSQVPGYGTPNYTVTYAMHRSTVIMPCNYTGFLDTANMAPFGGLIDVDWSNAKKQWTKHQPMDDESMLMEQLRRLKADDPGRKLWVYRGTIYAYPWYAETRRILDDPAYEPWFLHFRPGNDTFSPKCDVNVSSGSARKCTEYYHTQEQTPMYPNGPVNRGVCASPGCDCGTKPCGFYMYNHSAAEVSVKGQTLREWLIESYIFGNSDGIDGYYFDDYWNDQRHPPTEDYAHDMVQDVGLTTRQLHDITVAYNATIAELYKRTLARGKIAWQMCYGGSIFETREQKVTQKNCAESLRRHCAADSPTQTRAYLAAPRSSSAQTVQVGVNPHPDPDPDPHPHPHPHPTCTLTLTLALALTPHPRPHSHSTPLLALVLTPHRLRTWSTSCSSVGRTRGSAMAGAVAGTCTHTTGRCSTRTTESPQDCVRKRRRLV